MAAARGADGEHADGGSDPGAVLTVATASEAVRGTADRLIARIDRLVARQLDAILHHPRFLQLEGSWRGLAWLVRGAAAGSVLRIKVSMLAVSWNEIARDLGRAVEFDQSNLFRLVYDNEFGHPGGEPYGLLLMDQEVGHLPRARAETGLAPVDEVSLLSDLASIAAAAFAPIVVGASPALFGVDDYHDLEMVASIAGALDDPDHARWRSAARREDSRFVAVVPSRVLARRRWTLADGWRNGLRYAERAPGARERAWFSGAYAFASCVLRAVRVHAWPANVRGIVADEIGGGLVHDLPEEISRLGPDTAWRRPAVALGLTEPQERSLIHAGFMPLNTLPYGEAFFASARSLQTEWAPAAGRDMTPALANRRLSAQINAILTASRFAHYVKMLGRELVGSFNPPEVVQQRLQNWIIAYVNSNENSGTELRSRYPLRSARVAVNEIAGQPGAYGCIIHLQPHLQLDDVSTVFRLTTSFVSPAAREAVSPTAS